MRIIQRVVVVGVLLTLFLAVALLTYAKELEHDVRKVIRASHELSQRESPPTLDDIRQRFGTQLKQSGACARSGCEYEVKLSNELLSKLHLSPYTALRSSFWVRDNVLEENVLEVWTVSKGGGMMGAYVDAKYCEQCNESDIVPCVGTAASVKSGAVRIGARAVSAADRQAAFGFNAGCFSSVQGCASVAELLPSVWGTRSDGILQCKSFGPSGKP